MRGIWALERPSELAFTGRPPASRLSMTSLVAAAASPLLEATATAMSRSGTIAIRTKKVPPLPAP